MNPRTARVARCCSLFVFSATMLIGLDRTATPTAMGADLHKDSRTSVRPNGRTTANQPDIQDLALPSDLPASFMVSVSFEDVSYTLALYRRNLRAPGFRMRVQLENGQIVDVADPPPPLIYHGQVREIPGSVVLHRPEEGAVQVFGVAAGLQVVLDEG